MLNPDMSITLEYTGVSIFDSGFRIIDKTTGKIVADTKTQSDKSK